MRNSFRTSPIDGMSPASGRRKGMHLFFILFFALVSAENFLRIDSDKNAPRNRERHLQSSVCAKRCRKAMCPKVNNEKGRYLEDGCIKCYLECMKERMQIQEICGNEERYPVRWLKIRHVLYTGNFTYAVDVEVILASSISTAKHSLALEYRFSKADWRAFAVNAINNGHRFRVFGLKKGLEYQFRVWYVWDEEALCGMPFVSKLIEPECALLASVNASSFFKDVRFSVTTSGQLWSTWNRANSAALMTMGDHLLYYELACRGISGHHSNDCDFNQIHFYLSNETKSTSFMLPPIAGPCLYQVQLSAVFRKCPTKTFSKTIQYSPLSVRD